MTFLVSLNKCFETFLENLETSYNIVRHHETCYKTVSLSHIKAWLTIDYVASNTSVLTLVIICFDRYLSGIFLNIVLSFKEASAWSATTCKKSRNATEQ